MQISEQQHIKGFQKQINHDIYMELLALEEEQIELEKKLQHEKKGVMRQHLVKTIEDNKVKIQKKKDTIAKNKVDERSNMLKKQLEIEEELKVQAEEKVAKKHEMKDVMLRQLQAQKKKAEDAQELDRLAQIEADKQNQLFDNKERFKKQVRGQLVKESVLGNMDQIDNKRWAQNHQFQQNLGVKQENNNLKDNFDKSIHLLKMDDKMQRKTQMNDLKQLLGEQQNNHEQHQKNTLKMEKKLLQDATKFDVFVDDILEEKRKVLDKLRQERPF